MKIVNTNENCGTSQFYDHEIMAGHYERSNPPEWHRRDDGLLQADVQQGIVESLTEKYADIVPETELSGNSETEDTE